MEPNEDHNVQARRAFLAKCGKFAAITPVVMTGMLAASKQNFAVATSGGSRPHHPNNGYGNGAGDGIPGHSGGKGGGKKGPITDGDR